MPWFACVHKIAIKPPAAPGQDPVDGGEHGMQLLLRKAIEQEGGDDNIIFTARKIHVLYSVFYKCDLIVTTAPQACACHHFWRYLYIRNREAPAMDGSNLFEDNARATAGYEDAGRCGYMLHQPLLRVQQCTAKDQPGEAIVERGRIIVSLFQSMQIYCK